jgi:hypothetical protein
VATCFKMPGGKQHGFHEHQRVELDNRMIRVGKNPPGLSVKGSYYGFASAQTYRETAPMEWPIPINLLFEKSSFTGRFASSV